MLGFARSLARSFVVEVRRLGSSLGSFSFVFVRFRSFFVRLRSSSFVFVRLRFVFVSLSGFFVGVRHRSCGFGGCGSMCPVVAVCMGWVCRGV